MSIKQILYKMNKRHSKNKKNGFTLIELLVVISIVSLLSSILFASVSVASAKARDTRKIAEVASVRTALELYYSEHNEMPPMFNCSGSCVDGTRSTIQFEDTTNPKNPTSEAGKAYNRTMEVLVEEGFLSSVPHSPDNDNAYGYYNYGPGTVGAVFIANLETGEETSSGLPGTCRPWAASICPMGFLPADLNHDGSVDADDLEILSNNYGGPGNASQGDLDGDGQIGLNDLVRLANSYGSQCAQYTAPANACSDAPSREYCSCNPY